MIVERASSRDEYDPEKFCSRRVKRPDGRVTVMPPIGHGDAWSGDGSGSRKS